MDVDLILFIMFNAYCLDNSDQLEQTLYPPIVLGPVQSRTDLWGQDLEFH
jgi:hypothetical protein